MPHRSFTPRPPADAVTFDVDGEKFAAIGKAPAALYTEMVENGERVGVLTAQAMFVEAVLEPDGVDQAPRVVVEALRGTDPAATVEDRAAEIVAALRDAGLLRGASGRWGLALAERLDPADVNDIFNYLIETYADRPTGPPAG